ncbi:MAG: hypothetical protein SFV15_16830 [Polyangiaceae bacterium]|nr:hypothetical protein [Polyangiaceae bacterium]
MTATFESLMGLDSKWVSRGHQPLPEWWQGHYRAFYQHPTARTFVARVGRGGVKSHSQTKLSVNEVLFADWSIPPGEIHFWAYVSQNKDEASQRLRLIERLLSDLSIAFDRNGDEIILRHMPRGWRVFACQVGAVSGFRCFGYSADELSKWRSQSDLANPAAEVCASLNAMTVTHPGARRILVSSPLGTTDYHFDRCALGTDESQYFCEAATWVANPSITKEQTKRLEPDERVWAREYAAIPQASISAAFDADLIDAAFKHNRQGKALDYPIVVMDASRGLGRDETAWAPCVWRQHFLGEPLDFTRPLTDSEGNIVEELYQQANGKVLRDHNARPLLKPGAEHFTAPYLEFGPFQGTNFYEREEDVAASIYRTAWDWNACRVVGDQFGANGFASHFRRFQIQFRPVDVTAPQKEQAVVRLRRLLADRQVIFHPGDTELRLQLKRYSEIIRSSGVLKFSGKSQGRDDRAATVILSMIADAEGLIPGSPIKISGRRSPETNAHMAAIFT